jgi:hypothetical protein
MSEKEKMNIIKRGKVEEIKRIYLVNVIRVASGYAMCRFDDGKLLKRRMRVVLTSFGFRIMLEKKNESGLYII